MPLASALAAALAVAAVPAPAAAQQSAASRSSALAKELVDVLTKQKRDSIAVRDPEDRERFIAAMTYPGQLMVVAGKYTVPVLLDEKISFNKHMEVYVELNGAAVPASKVFFEDQFADGLAPTRKQSPFDSMTLGSQTMLFDGDHRKKKISKEDYNKAFADADAQYSKLLELLIKQAKAAGDKG